MSDITGGVLRNRYQVERLLGRGGMADVYLAFDMHRQTRVAIKLIREDLADDADFVRRFSREADALARLDHPNVVRYYATEQDGLLSFIVMDYVPGSNLQRRLAQAGGPLPLAEVTALVHQIGPALHYAHTLGFIHRDIKPGNIMLREDGTALLSDFGAARVVENATLASISIGTPAYMSPEQILGRDLQPQSDIYSFGLVLFEMLTGRRPFTGDEEGLTGSGTISRLREAHLRLDPPNPTEFNPAIPPQIGDVVLRAMAKDVTKRWPNVMSLVEAWDAALSNADLHSIADDTVSAATFASVPTVVQPSTPSSAASLGSSGAPASSRAAAPFAPSSQPQPVLAAQPPSAGTPPPLVQAEPPKKGPRALWVIPGIVAGLIILTLVTWRVILPGFATSQAASLQSDNGSAAALEGPARTATAAAATQQAAARATTVAQSTASAVSVAQTATATGKVVAEVAQLAAAVTAQAVFAEAATATTTAIEQAQAEAATATAIVAERAQAEAATATAQAAHLAQGTATAGAEPTSTATATATPQPEPTATPQPPAPAAPRVILDFETNTVWQIGDQPYGTFDRSTEQAHGGRASGRLHYDFPAVQDSYVVFQAVPAITLGGQPTGLTAWVYGNGSGHYLNVWVQDGSGQVRQYTFGRIMHQGWQQMTAWFDDTRGWPNVHISGPDNGKLSYPASLWAFVLDAVPHGKASSGTIYIDDVATIDRPIPKGTPAAEAPVAEAPIAAVPVSAATAPSGPGLLRGTIAVSLFARDRGTYDVYVASVNDGRLQRVQDYASQAALSPDGTQLAYRRWKSDDRGVEIMPTYGGPLQRLTHFLEDGLPSWSPDGRLLVFASRRESDRKARIYEVAASGGADRQLKRGADPIFGEYPTWLPDGNIVYRSTWPQQGLVVINSDGSNPRLLFNDATATAPVGAPGGGPVAFMSQRDGNWEIYRIGLDGSGLARLTDSPSNDGLPAWSPDGSALAFLSDRDGGWGVWMMAADGSGQRKLFALPGSPDGRVAGEPDYSSRGWTEERLSWSS